MKIHLFNAVGLCTNPEIFFETARYKPEGRVVLEVANINGWYFYGWSVHTSEGGCIKPCIKHQVTRSQYIAECMAVEDALRYVRDQWLKKVHLANVLMNKLEAFEERHMSVPYRLAI